MSDPEDIAWKLACYADELLKLPSTHSVALMTDRDRCHFSEMIEERRGLDELKEWLINAKVSLQATA